MTMVDRNFAHEMRKVIDAHTADGPYTSRQAAREVVETLETTDPDLLYGWLRVHAEELVWQMINTRDRSLRSSARRTAGSARFAAAVEAADNGDIAQLGSFLSIPYVVGDGTRRRLGDLTAEDLTVVADAYDRRAADNAMSATFLRTLAKRIGEGRVADHFDEAELAEIWKSITRT